MNEELIELSIKRIGLQMTFDSLKRIEKEYILLGLPRKKLQDQLYELEKEIMKKFWEEF